MRSRRRRSPFTRLAIAAAATALAGAGAGLVLVRTGHDVETPHSGRSSPSSGPRAVDLSGLAAAPRPVAHYAPATGGTAISRAAVTRLLHGLLTDPALGDVSAEVVDVTTGTVLYNRAAERLAVPASTTKLVTALAALLALPAATRLATKVVAAPPVGGTVAQLTLVGGGDPTLASEAAVPRYGAGARLSALAGAVAKRVRRISGGIVVDDSRYAGATLGPGWKATYVDEGSVAPVRPVEVDEGRRDFLRSSARLADPDLAAGRLLRTMLVARGVAVGGGVTRGGAPRTSVTLGSVLSPRVGVLVERMLRNSDNDLAEALGRAVAAATGRVADFDGEVRGLGSALSRVGLGAVPQALRDASGLSRSDRLTAAGLVSVVRFAAADPRGRGLLAGLPVAGFDGTLANRFHRLPAGAVSPDASAAAGLVRAKTGTLDHVTTLAGTALTRSGRLLAFAFLADRVPTTSVGKAAARLDRAAAGLASCGCAA